MKQTDDILCHTRREPKRIVESWNIWDKPSQNTHSFGLVLPAIFPACVISSCVCIVLLFETSSSSHVQYHIARQRGPLGPEPAIGPCLTASDHEICHICIKCTNLVAPKSFSYWFSGWPRCNPLKQTDNILCHTRRGPKRIDQSWDIDEKPSQTYI